MRDQTAETIAETFFSGWIARFGVPDTITTDRGTNFESLLFSSFSRFLGSYKTRTTAYNPKSNGMVERFHRQLKAAIMSRSSKHWFDALPHVLLGIRSSLKEDVGASPADLVYGAPLRLPGEFFRNSFSPEMSSRCEFLTSLQSRIRQFRPVPASNHSATDTFVYKDLSTAKHVFVRVDSVRRPLQQPYQGPFLILSRSEKYFTVDVNGKSCTISIDRLKPAHILAEHSSDGPEAKPSHSSVPSWEPKSTTRSGRISRPVVRFQS
jgi:cleavage and polyadenylation specificity factor subunit 1